MPLCFTKLNEAPSRVDSYQHLFVTDFCPSDVQSHYRYIQRLKASLKVLFVLLTYSPGNNKGNLHFIWQVDSTDSTETIFQKSLPVVDVVKNLLPQYLIHKQCAEH